MWAENFTGRPAPQFRSTRAQSWQRCFQARLLPAGLAIVCVSTVTGVCSGTSSTISVMAGFLWAFRMPIEHCCCKRLANSV
eukprot:g24545.t1